MRHRVLGSVGIGVLVIAAVGLGQPPGQPPAPPPVPTRPLPPVTPAGATTPAPTARPASPTPETALSRFDPLTAFPLPTQQAVRSVILGSGWMLRMNQPQGRFLYGYLPSVRRPMDGDHDLKQAHAALALAQSAKFCGDDRQAAVAGQAILTLLAVTRPDPADPNCRVPVRSSLTCNRVGFAAVLALAIYELPGADEKLIAEAEKLCAFIHKQLRSDGSVHYTDGPTDVPTQVDPGGVNEYPGLALHAIAVGNRLRPAPWKPEAVRKGMGHYRAWFKAHPHPMLAATLTPAFAELFLQTNTPEIAATVFELNDWLVSLQYTATDPRNPQWAGGFKDWANGHPVDAMPGCECGPYLQSLACACRLTRQTADVTRFGRYRQAATDAMQFLGGLQYAEANTRHFENAFRANMLIGGFHLSPVDGNLRIDATARAITGTLGYLGSGAER